MTNSDRNSLTSHYTPCLTLIRAIYSQLTQSERIVADYILENPGSVLRYSIAEVGKQSGVGLATVNRLCTKLNYRSYSDMKIALAIELLNPDNTVPDPVSPDDDAATLLQKITNIAIQNLRDTAALLDPAALAQATEIIASAQRVECYATGGLSGPIAHMTQHRLLNLGIMCSAYSNPQQQVISAKLLSPNDVALGLSHSGESPFVAEALQIAREVGAKTVCITSSPLSTVAHASDLILLIAKRETIVGSDQVTSRMSMLGVLETLYASVALQKYHQQLG
jgi:RpiR family carbohydrate utilization transcriptional regulator